MENVATALPRRRPVGTLTDRKLKALKRKPAAPGTTYDVADGVVPGLAVRVMPSGQRSFVLVARFPGKNGKAKNPTRRSLGAYGALTLEKAREKARIWLDLIDRGIDPRFEEERLRQAALRRQENSFAAVAEQFIKRHLSKTRKATIVERELRREFIARWGARPITDITQHDVVAVIDAVVDRGALYQAHNLLGHVRVLFNWAIARGIYGLERSPCDRLRPAAVIGKKLARRRVLDDDELYAFWRATRRLGYPYGPLFRMLALTGQRKSEVAEARWLEFDLTRKLWTIPAERMKADAAHVVPLTDDVIAILHALPRFKKGDHVFSTTFGVKPINGFSKAKERLDRRMLRSWRALARTRGEDRGKEQIEPFVIHDIRRTMRTGLSVLPVPDLVRELVIAHTKPGLHKVYDQFAYVVEKRHALEQWAARLRSIVGLAPTNVVTLQTTAR
jgi:integrase